MEPQHIIDWIVLLAWIILMVTWLISALFAKPYERRGQGWLWRWVAVIIILSLFRFDPQFENAFAYSLFPASLSLEILGAVLTVLGVALALWARYHLGKNWGMPASLKKDAQLVTTGPYAYIRNPIYTAFLLAFLGSALAVSVLWSVVFIIFGAYFVYASKIEEKIMAAKFPNEYPAYKARTKMLVPFVL